MTERPSVGRFFWVWVLLAALAGIAAAFWLFGGLGGGA